ncbi:uncharacterized protein LAESUDRAFT_645560 [Laetiporus sulphureus 93-53]|uniref:CHCH domain-containing protein n=1 Tax=Laetiporus sulphureus 93-53 TaxID=1314785 RepID=A0A165GAM5_9APHY|nr:uncharacterized protein LAESUDRAFT_645560 [Laetiporus sulphureus 93-53]KZT10076.1 hypothetical protein LAESUDRAFT_645560 [Laetiporus sulphureus 93-53]
MAVLANETTKTPAAPLPNPRDNAKPDNYITKFKGKQDTKFVDPCERASKASMDCMNRHDFDRDKCLDFFRAYRDCKKDWLDQRRADRRAGRPSV